MAKPGTLQEKNWEKDRKASVRPKKTAKSDNEESSKDRSASGEKPQPKEKA